MQITPTKDPILAPGTQLSDDLTIVEHLGGSHKVDLYVCRSGSRKDLVACKVLHPDYASKESSLKALKREGAIIASFRHENVVQGFGVALDDHPRVEMELLDGQTVGSAFLTGNYEAFDLEDVLNVALAIGDALAYIHTQGVLHLDVKPSNVMYLDGHSTLFDFSIAECITPGKPLRSNAGTREYMAPEQTLKEALTYATDVFGLGVMLYELLTGGQMPYGSALAEEQSDDDDDSPLDYDTAPVHPSFLNPAVPEAIGEVVLRAINPDPCSRYQTAAAFCYCLRKAAGLSS